MVIVTKRVLFIILAAAVLNACALSPHHVGKPTSPISQDHFAEITRPDIPLEMNDRVQDWIDYFQGPSRDRFGRYLARSAKYIPMMRKILREQGLPQNLVYLSMIESGFNPHAYSRARATGAWQFVYLTGVRYGLRVNSWVDERRDPEKSTIAAAKYLKDLYDRFNNWYLAAASYNAGEGKIDRAIRKYATEDFWELSERRYLKKETKNYVPKLIAAALISMNPSKYGFRDIPYEEPIPYEEVSLDSPLDLRVAAKCAGVSYEEIKGLNPELLHWMTPADYPGYRLKIPKGTLGRFGESLAALSPAQMIGGQTIEVRGRMSVAQLAKKNHLPAPLLAMANGLSVKDTVGPGETLVRPYDPPEGETFKEKVYENRRRGHHRHHRGGKRVTAQVHKHQAKSGYVSHKIRSGETLSKIAKKYNVSPRQVQAANGISRKRRLRAGKVLRIPVPQTVSAGMGTSM